MTLQLVTVIYDFLYYAECYVIHIVGGGGGKGVNG